MVERSAELEIGEVLQRLFLLCPRDVGASFDTETILKALMFVVCSKTITRSSSATVIPKEQFLVPMFLIFNAAASVNTSCLWQKSSYRYYKNVHYASQS